MRTAKRPVIIAMAVVISLGLMYSQLCGVLCDISGCSSPAPANFAAASNSGSAGLGSHGCEHHKQTKPKDSEQAGHHARGAAFTTSEGPGHPHGSGCFHSHDQIGLFSTGGKSADSFNQQPHPIIGAVSPAADTSFAELVGETTARTPDRSPPRRVASVLRI